jgi:hypothetical protein
MVTKSKKSSRKVKVNKLSRSTKTVGKDDMKKVKGGAGIHFKVEYKPHG